jgi:predicted RecA/RadA family phage recombinase
MAYEIPGFSWTLVAGEDLSSSQFCGIDVELSTGQAVLPSAGGRTVGVLQNKPDDGEAATIVTSGVSKMLVGATGLVAGNNVAVDTDGKAVQAAANDQSIGVALQTAAAGSLAAVLLLIGQSVVAGS